ncbi:zinc cluster transcription factor [Salix suchowensis]|nr:zinc cluster transcription factor [Salix suchowensis]
MQMIPRIPHRRLGSAFDDHSPGLIFWDAHAYVSFPHGVMQTQAHRSKRRQVKNACTNCQKACKKCDDARPCLRCVKYGIAEEQQRRPPSGRPSAATAAAPTDAYLKRRSATGPSAQRFASYRVPHDPCGVSSRELLSVRGSPMSKPGEGQPAYYPPFLVPAVPHPQQQHGHPGAEGDNQGYPMAPQFYPAFVPSLRRMANTWCLHVLTAKCPCQILTTHILPRLTCILRRLWELGAQVRCLMGHIWDTLGRAIAGITKFVIMEKKASRTGIYEFEQKEFKKTGEMNQEGSNYATNTTTQEDTVIPATTERSMKENVSFFLWTRYIPAMVGLSTLHQGRIPGTKRRLGTNLGHGARIGKEIEAAKVRSEAGLVHVPQLHGRGQEQAIWLGCAHNHSK